MMSSLLKDLAEIGIAVGSNDIKVEDKWIHPGVKNVAAERPSGSWTHRSSSFLLLLCSSTRAAAA